VQTASGSAASPSSQTIQSGTAATGSASSTVANTQVTTQGTLIVIQNGPGNSIALPANISADALSTIIQNTLNDQIIRNITTINLTIETRMLAAQARLDAILNESLRGLR
jgi:hypothetical protein